MSGDGAVIGIDVGGTSIAVDLVDLTGRALFSASCPTGRGRAAIDAVLAQLTAAEAAARDAGIEMLGVGLLSPGHVDEQRGIVRFASNLGWTDLDLPGKIIAARSEPLPVVLGHDVRWAGIAEGVLGAAAGLEDYALVAIGTGIAACLVSGGQVLTGADGSAGEFGHTTVVPAGDRCACGRTGCVDAYASGAALLRRYRELGGARELSDVAELLTALSDDPVARRVWDDGLEALARGLCSLTMTVDPGTIVIAGGLSGAGEELTVPLRSRLEQQLVWKRAPDVTISPLGGRAGRAGAVLLALTAAGKRASARTWNAQTVESWSLSTGPDERPVRRTGHQASGTHDPEDGDTDDQLR